MDQLMVRVINALCDDVGTPLARRLKDIVAEREWSKVLDLQMSVPASYDDSEAFFKDALIVDLLRKCKLPTGIDTEAVAISTFWACEAQNARTNADLTRFLRGGPYGPADEPVLSFITKWRKEVSSILGKLPLDLVPRFSGGSTYADSGTLITIPDKMSSVPTITRDARDVVLPLWERTSWARARLEERPLHWNPETVRGNIFFTVPKDGKTDRGCCKEPSLNVCYQLAVGREIRSRLKRAGVDLLKGQQRHRHLAKVASADGSLSTIDMSNASDTISRVLVELILPKDWFELLNSLRSRRTRMPDGRWVFLEKFSSMGNGFTFELETLLFLTLARTCASGDARDVITCYGDDLIVDSTTSSCTLAALRRFGFSPNLKKTFVEGPFRESCGGDFFSGTPVRAHFIKELPDEPQQWIALANGLRRVAFADGSPPTRWAILRRAWLRCLDAIPSDIRRCRGPEYLGDIVIHDDDDRVEFHRHPNMHASHEARYVRAYVPIPVVLPWHHWTPLTQLASCTLGCESSGITPRGGVSGFKIRLVNSLPGGWEPSNTPI